MDISTKQMSASTALSAAILKLLRPLVRVLLRNGMAYGTFAEVARKAFVEEGFKLIADSGKRPSDSSVSALTGLTRKETKRLRELEIVGNQDSSQRYNRAIRVVSAWADDPHFLNASGEPAILPMEGEQGSFSALVKNFSGDIPTAAMLSVLESSGTVEVVAGGVALRRRAYIPEAAVLDKINILGTDVAELIDTIGHNLVAEPEARLFQRKVSNIRLRADAVPAFRELTRHKSQALLEEYHHWLSSREVDPEVEADVESCYVAVGIYYTEHPVIGEEIT